MFYISDIIRKLMIDRRINVTDLSRKLGITTPNLSRKFQNQTEDYKISYLSNVMQALNCSIQIQIIDNNNNDVLYTISDTKTD
jgi:DNA-binding Xre family transcriptional regulator